MRLVPTLLAAVSMMALATAAHATTIGAGTYNLENAYVYGYAVTGTITFNDSSVATSVNLAFNDPAYSPVAIVFNNIVQSDTYSGLGQNYFTAPNNGGQIGLYFINTQDANGNYDLCLHNGACGGSTGDSTLQTYGYSLGAPTWQYVPGLNVQDFSSGYLSAVPSNSGTASLTSTPEPSSLMLLGTGVLGFAGVMRRRFIKA